MNNCSSNFLIWNHKCEFVRIAEGSGDNLSPEDIDNGYVDYIVVDYFRYDGHEFIQYDSGDVLLTDLYQKKFQDCAEVVQYLIDEGWLPDDDYIYLYIEAANIEPKQFRYTINEATTKTIGIVTARSHKEAMSIVNSHYDNGKLDKASIIIDNAPYIGDGICELYYGGK